MLSREQLRCGIFDSTVSRKNMTRTPERTVQAYEIELYHARGGIGYVDGEACPIRRGLLLIARPGQVRYSHLPLRSSYIRVWPDRTTEELLKSLPVSTQLDDPEEINSLLYLFARLHGVLMGSVPEWEGTVEANAVFLQILQSVLRLVRRENRRPAQRRLVRDACDYMDRHFNKSCSLEQIAAYVHVSPNHLHTVFLRDEGKTPYEYVTEKRVERAKTLILMGERTLAQIALETGFCSQSHFTATFKKITGKTPARYRRELFDLV